MKRSLAAAPIYLAFAGGRTPVALGQQSPGQQNTERPDLLAPYRAIVNVLTMPPGRTIGSTNAINVDARGNVWVFERCGATFSDTAPFTDVADAEVGKW